MDDPIIQIRFNPVAETFMPPEKVKDGAMELFGNTTRGATHILQSVVVDNTPQCFGHLRNSINAETIINSDQIIGQVKTSIPYALPVETGTKPHWPPLAPLVLWVRRKLGGQVLIEAKAEARGLHKVGFKGIRATQMRGGIEQDIARRIQFTIARRGTRGAHMFAKGFQYRKGRVENMFERTIDKFIEFVQKL